MWENIRAFLNGGSRGRRTKSYERATSTLWEDEIGWNSRSLETWEYWAMKETRNWTKESPYEIKERRKDKCSSKIRILKDCKGSAESYQEWHH